VALVVARVVARTPVHLVLVVHRVEAQALERHHVSCLESAEVQQHVGPLAGGEEEFRDAAGHFQRAAVGAGEPEGQEVPADVGEGQPVGAGVRGVQEPETVGPARNM
jgi:hypothetical protein